MITPNTPIKVLTTVSLTVTKNKQAAIANTIIMAIISLVYVYVINLNINLLIIFLVVFTAVDAIGM